MEGLKFPTCKKKVHSLEEIHNLMNYMGFKFKHKFNKKEKKKIKQKIN
jgi:hypothetical protein